MYPFNSLRFVEMGWMLCAAVKNNPATSATIRTLNRHCVPLEERVRSLSIPTFLTLAAGLRRGLSNRDHVGFLELGGSFILDRSIELASRGNPPVIASEVMALRTAKVDYLVMGAGVAGLRAAIELAEHGDVLVVTKESLGESNTHYAQGGIAVAMEGDEDVALHLKDTVTAGDGLVYVPAAEALVAEGPERVAELIEWGARFDREGGRCCAPARAPTHCLAFCMPTAMRPGRRSAGRWWLLRAPSQRIRFAEWTTVTGL